MHVTSTLLSNSPTSICWILVVSSCQHLSSLNYFSWILLNGSSIGFLSSLPFLMIVALGLDYTDTILLSLDSSRFALSSWNLLKAWVFLRLSSFWGVSQWRVWWWLWTLLFLKFSLCSSYFSFIWLYQPLLARLEIADPVSGVWFLKMRVLLRGFAILTTACYDSNDLVFALN